MSKHLNSKKSLYDLVIIGGLGHVGLPLGLAFADKGLRVCLYDIDKNKGDSTKEGKMPFIEHGAEEILKKTLVDKTLQISYDLKVISKAKYVVITIGTPVDEYLNPETRQFLEFIRSIKKYLHTSQTIIIRSTVYPNTCHQVLRLFGNKNWQIAYCPERIAQGHALEEFKEFPQIVSGFSKKAVNNAVKLFNLLAPKIVKTSVGEAELAKLFSNTFRYVQFAVSNQFYMIAHKFGIDYEKVRHAMTDRYGRSANLPTAGFAAGPCLLKDTMQLAAFDSNNFLLGHAAMMINEGLPSFIVEDLKQRYDLKKTKVGILGMAFKADIDDIRDSLSYKLGKILRFYGTDVYYSDDYVKDKSFISKEKLIKICDVVIIGVPHSAYKGIVIPKYVEVVDLWNIVDGGGKNINSKDNVIKK